MLNIRYQFILLTLVICDCKGYTILPRSPVSVPVLRNAPFVYRGPVFIVQETDDPNEPFVGRIVEGGIELVQQHVKTLTKSHLRDAFGLNDTAQDMQEDPEYFTVLVTPEMVAQAQISRTTTITVPLSLLLIGVSARIPWVMVLKRKTHMDHFNTFIPFQILNSQRRRARSMNFQGGRLFADTKKYDMIYTNDDKDIVHQICTDIVQDLIHLNSLLNQNQTNDTDDILVFNTDEDPSQSNSTKPANSTTKLNQNLSTLKESYFLPNTDFNIAKVETKTTGSNKTDRGSGDDYDLKIIMN